MPDVYQQVTNDEGEVTYEVVNVDDLPEVLSDEQARQTPAYKKTLDESVRRRQTIAAMKEERAELQAQLAAANDVPEPSEDDAEVELDGGITPTVTQPAPVIPSMDEFLEQVIDRLDTRSADLEAENVEYRARIDQLISDHNLSEEARTVLEGSTDPDETAAYLGRLKTRFDDVTGGELPTTADALEGISQRVLEKLGLND